MDFPADNYSRSQDMKEKNVHLYGSSFDLKVPGFSFLSKGLVKDGA
jgi:hypothetical protein